MPTVDFVHENFDNNFHNSTINYLIEQEDVYAPDPHYLEKNQTHLRWKMRSILLDWMQEVCSDYLLKRETYYYAVNYVDRYLSLVPNVEKKSLQLVGLTCLYLAAKVEEVLLPKVENMVLAANNTYTASQIIKMETTIYFTLGFKVTPPTLNSWANWYVAQWDNFIEESSYAQRNVLASSVKTPIKFKLPTQHSYTLYRHLMQLIDATVLEIQTLQYKQRALVLSIMYVLIGREFHQFTTEMIVQEFPVSSQYLLDTSFAYNNLFGHFVQECFGIELSDLLPTIQYVSSFFNIEFDISLPIAAKIDKENVLQVD
jgi:cyclin E